MNSNLKKGARAKPNYRRSQICIKDLELDLVGNRVSLKEQRNVTVIHVSAESPSLLRRRREIMFCISTDKTLFSSHFSPLSGFVGLACTLPVALEVALGRHRPPSGEPSWCVRIWAF